MMLRCREKLAALLLFASVGALSLHAELLRRGGPDARGDDADAVSVGHEITVREGDTVGDIVCAFCTVRLHGDAGGDIVTFFGKIYVDPERTVRGDLVAFGGRVALGKDASVAGDAVVFGSSLQEAGGASIRGDKVILPGFQWLLLAALAPVLILAGLAWLVVWLVRRQRYRGLLLR